MGIFRSVRVSDSARQFYSLVVNIDTRVEHMKLPYTNELQFWKIISVTFNIIIMNVFVIVVPEYVGVAVASHQDSFV